MSTTYKTSGTQLRDQTYESVVDKKKLKLQIKGTENLLNEITAENSPKLGKKEEVFTTSKKKT
jgi:hypothetical protein